MKRKSFVLVTDNNEDKIEIILRTILPRIRKNDELIIFDNQSTDETFPIIVSTIGIGFKEENKYKCYINTKKETIDSTLKKAISIARGKVHVIDVKESSVENGVVVRC